MQVKNQLEDNGIEVREYMAVSSDVVLLASNELDATSTVRGTPTKVTGEVKKNLSETDKKVNGNHQAEENTNDLIWADPGSCCYALYSKLNHDKVLLQQSPLALAKALKVVHIYPANKGHLLFG